MASVIQKASTTRHISVGLEDLYALKSILPEHLRTNDRFIEFLEAYFEWQQSEITSPSRIINDLEDMRNIDIVADEFLGYLQREFAAPIPNIDKVDRRKLYKQVNDLYRAKGSIPSYEALFNLLFEDEIELYFPRVDMLIPSSGKWDDVSKRYMDTNGFCSDRKKLQDSYYYQDYSYVIKTGKTFDEWKDIVTKVLHPAGFVFFGQIKIVSLALKQALKMPFIQPGQLASEPPFIPLFADVVKVTPKLVQRTTTLLKPATLASYAFGPTLLHLEQTKFLLTDAITKYSNLTFDDVARGAKTHLVPNPAGNLGLGDGYTDTTVRLGQFLAYQPADMGASPAVSVINLEEPTDVDVTIDLG